jgi:hypothetical protein
MLVANTVINATRAAVGLMKAGVGIYEALDNRAKQQEIKIYDAAKDELEIQIAKDIKSGRTRMTIDPDGQPIFTGLTLEAEAIRARYEERIRNEMGGTARGNAGRAVESLNQLYSNLNAGAAKMIADKSFQDVEKLFFANAQDGIQEFTKTGSRSLFDQTMDQAKSWMSPEVWDLYKTKFETEMSEGRTKNIGLSIAQAKGVGATDTFWKNQDITEEQRIDWFSAAQQASNQAVTAATATVKEKYTQAIDGGATIGNAYRAAIANPSSNPAVAEAAKEAAQALQSQSLNDRHGKNLAGAEAMTLRQLENLRQEYVNYEGDYQDQGLLYKQHLAEIDSYIARKKAQEAAAANAAGTTGTSSRDRLDAENAMANYFVRFNSRELDGPAAIEGIRQYRSLAPEKAAEYEAKILGDKRNPAIQNAYGALDDIIKSLDPGDRASPQAKMAHAKYATDIRQLLFQKHFEGATDEQLMSAIEGHRIEAASKILREAWEAGDIGSSGLGQGWGPFGKKSADKVSTAFVYYSNLGHYDLRYGHRTMDAQRTGPKDAMPLTAGGDNAVKVMNKVADHNKGFANKELELAGIQMVEVIFEESSPGDRTGAIHYEGSDGRIYRVNATAENGKRFLERLENDGWTNIKNLPDIQKLIEEGRRRREAESLKRAQESSGMQWW